MSGCHGAICHSRVLCALPSRLQEPVLLYLRAVIPLLTDETHASDAGLIDRMLAASRLDAAVFEYVAVQRSTRWQAVAVVMLAGLANGLGLMSRFGLAALLVGLVQALIAWVLWSAVVVIVALLLGARRRNGSVLRATAFANSPGVLLVLGAVPVIGGLLRSVVAAWMVAATVPAVRALYGLRRWRAVAVAVGAFVAYWAIGQLSDYFIG